MNRIIDYFFYRTYIAYRNANDPAKIGSMMYLWICFFFCFLPIFAFFAEIVRGDNLLYFNCVFAIYCFLVFLYIFLRYMRKNKIREMIVKFSNSSLNNAIPTWCFFLVLPICMIVGVTAFFLVKKHIVAPYKLTGIGYHFLEIFFGY